MRKIKLLEMDPIFKKQESKKDKNKKIRRWSHLTKRNDRRAKITSTKRSFLQNENKPESQENC